MNERFYQDARLWEEGSLSLAELEARYPHRDVKRLAQISEELGAIARMETPDPESGWAVVQNRLSERVPSRTSNVYHLRRRVRRALVAGVAAAMLAGTSAAYAAGVQPVRHVVHEVVDGVTNLFGGNDGDQNNTDQGTQGNTGTDQNNIDQGTQGDTGTDQPNGDQGTQGDTGTNQPNVDQGTQGNIGTDQNNSGGGQ